MNDNKEDEPELKCPNCQNDNLRMITIIRVKPQRRYFCEVCAKEWVVIP